MTIRHLFGREDIYVIHSDRAAERGEPWWRESRLGLYAPEVEASAEWTLLSKYNFGLGFQFGRNGSKSDVGLDIHVWRLTNIWLRLRSPWTKWLRVRSTTDKHRYEARQTSISLLPGEGAWIRLQFEGYQRHMASADPWWRRGWHWGSHEFWGGRVCVTEQGTTGVAPIPLPEGNYVGAWTEEVRTWRFKRFPGTLRDRISGPMVRRSVAIKIEGGIPVEGKGENSWDCGMDGLFGTGGATVEDAVAECVRSVLRDRKRHGGPHDLPWPMTVSEVDAWRAEQRA